MGRQCIKDGMGEGNPLWASSLGLVALGQDMAHIISCHLSVYPHTFVLFLARSPSNRLLALCARVLLSSD